MTSEQLTTDSWDQQGPAQQVVITGLGVLSCLGSGVEAFWKGMAAGSSRPRFASDPSANIEIPLMYTVSDDDIPVNEGDPLGRTSRMAIAATRQAVADAGLEDVPSSCQAVVIGTGMGESGLHEQRRAEGSWSGDQWSPAFAVASAVGDFLGTTGANVSTSNACAASGFALSLAADLITSGEADVVIAGGAESYSRVALACFNRLGAIDPERCRPFDRERKGTVFGEGAAIFVLESERHAQARGARHAYARLAGAGWSCDAYHMTAPEPEGEQIILAMRRALAQADASEQAVGCVVPHGTGTELNDVVEAKALQRIMGSRCDQVPLCSIKSLIGHTGGAAGALAALAAALIVDRGEVPPNARLDEHDPECEVWIPTDEPTPLSNPLALVNAYAFGGNNVSLALEGVV